MALLLRLPNITTGNKASSGSSDGDGVGGRHLVLVITMAGLGNIEEAGRIEWEMVMLTPFQINCVGIPDQHSFSLCFPNTQENPLIFHFHYLSNSC